MSVVTFIGDEPTPAQLGMIPVRLLVQYSPLQDIVTNRLWARARSMPVCRPGTSAAAAGRHCSAVPAARCARTREEKRTNQLGSPRTVPRRTCRARVPGGEVQLLACRQHEDEDELKQVCPGSGLPDRSSEPGYKQIHLKHYMVDLHVGSILLFVRDCKHPGLQPSCSKFFSLTDDKFVISLNLVRYYC